LHASEVELVPTDTWVQQDRISSNPTVTTWGQKHTHPIHTTSDGMDYWPNHYHLCLGSHDTTRSCHGSALSFRNFGDPDCSA